MALHCCLCHEHSPQHNTRMRPPKASAQGWTGAQQWQGAMNAHGAPYASQGRCSAARPGTTATYLESTGDGSLKLLWGQILSLGDGGKVGRNKGANGFQHILPLYDNIAVQIFLFNF